MSPYLQVQALFADCAEQITEAVEQLKSQTEQNDEAVAWKTIQAEGKHQSIQASSCSILGHILDLNRALQG